MCGIAGLLAPDLAPHERLAHVQRMIECLTHRGPDGVALWDGDGIALGLSRLAIVAPHLPARLAVDEENSIHAVVNGEIYNHHALRAWLAERGHDSAGGPDTSVVPHLYEEVGAAFPERLDGMFAAAVWDGPRHRLVLARDRAGEKPLFIATAPGRFAFASEPAALLSLPWVSRDPAPESLARYLAHGFFADVFLEKSIGVIEVFEELGEKGIAVSGHGFLDALKHTAVHAFGVVVGFQ